MKQGIRVYNLYPKLVGAMDKWVGHFDAIQDMGFNWVYVNPFHAPGFSGSDYAVKDYFLYHPLFVTGEMDFSDLPGQKAQGDKKLKLVCAEAEKRGLKIMMDLVINHTAVDSPLTQEHPDWYMKNDDGSIKNPGALDGDQWITWGDLAQIDNLKSPDRDNLWKYWLDMMLHYCNLGIRGFRCDAAYHVPAELWSYLVPRIKEKYPDAVFMGETLGCTPAELMEVAHAGFDFVMNSFKWWDYRADYFLRDYSAWAGKVPSLTFPENHDTLRYAQETGGNREMALVKYALGAFFCAGIAITQGFELGFQRKIDVVQTTPDWWEEGAYNITAEIALINKTKSSFDVLQEDNMIVPYDFHDGALFGFAKESLDGKEKIFVIANVNPHAHPRAQVPGFHAIMGGAQVLDLSLGHRMDRVPESLDYTLQPGEVKLFYFRKA